MTDSSATARNRLAGETSPYLQQHADNPVDWFPWGETALAEARRLNRPILLSIGYSACHWCHVMARESFSDPDTAAVMNQRFINIKVDREERPDLDRIYQTAHQLLTGRGGGWPLTVFLAPDQTPFFAGTYFPPSPRHGMPGFTDVLERVAGAWAEQPDAIGDQNAALREALSRLAQPPAGEAPPGRETLDRARAALGEAFDARFGGFGGAPKFPQPTRIQRLLRHYALTQGEGRPDRDALHMACLTLRRMALGGIYDQVGGGFARYSVDEYWIIPHFEKMLTDNGQLLGLYADAWRATGDGLFRRVARETADWLLREMRHPEGGFFTALDADSEGGEGRFYLWTPEGIRAVLDRDEAELVELRFGLDERPNFEGQWHLHVNMTFSELAKRLREPRQTVVQRWTRARAKLRAARDGRPRPARDEKVLTGANALTIIGLSRAGRLFGEPSLVDAAERALTFLHTNAWRDGRLLASWRDGVAHTGACLDDHAALILALLEQLQSRWHDDWLAWARTLADALLERFEDDQRGGFFLTPSDHEPLIQRPKAFSDDAAPAGNGLAALALGRLGHLTGDPACIAAAERTLVAAEPSVRDVPDAHAALLDAAEDALYPPETVLIRPPGGDEPSDWRDAAEAQYTPRRQVFVLESGGAALGDQLPDRGARVCRGTTCLPQCDTPRSLADRLAEH